MLLTGLMLWGSIFRKGGGLKEKVNSCSLNSKGNY